MSLPTAPSISLPQRPSFAAVVAGVPSLGDSQIQAKVGTKDGIPSVIFENSDLARAAKLFRLAVVMKFAANQRPSVDNIRSIINSKWGMNSTVSVSLLDAKNVLLNFIQESDLLKVLSRDSTRIEGVFYKIFKCTPEFNPKTEVPIVLIWIQLFDLPVHLYPSPFLKQIVRPIGEYLRADNATLRMTNTQRARICVMVDLRKELPKQIWVNTATNFVVLQKVTYEEVPNFCFHCQMQGHEKATCRKLKPPLNREEEAPKGVTTRVKDNQPIQSKDTSVYDALEVFDKSTNTNAKEDEDLYSRKENAPQLFDNIPKTNSAQTEVMEFVVVEDGPKEAPITTSSNPFASLCLDTSIEEGEKLVEDVEDNVLEEGVSNEIVNLVLGMSTKVVDVETTPPLDEVEIVPETPINSPISQTLQEEGEVQQYEHGDVTEEQVDNELQHLPMLEQVEAIVEERDVEEQTNHCLPDKEKDYILLSPQQVQVDREAALILARMEVTRLEKMVAEPKQKKIGKKNKKFAEATNASPTF